jgi:Thermostable hemolysin
MFVVVSRHDRRRSAVENLIRQLYWRRYRAVPSFASTIVAELDHTGRVECAAGIRFGEESFFSECYLDRPIEEVLRTRVGQRVCREQMVEVCHLAGTKPGRSAPFIESLIDLLRGMGSEWAIFTAIKPLRNLLQRNRLAMVELALADKRRVPDPGSWGSYFEYDPRIMAVSHGTAFGSGRLRVCPSVMPSAADARIF